ncbi:TonB-dependent receptor family protein [Gilliamella sp. wkB112]|uniref:TonB-dependent receptor family protein n=1 Tax=Gilliamella sp. wkB112 TaxID=3120257 RepID=UPI00080DCF01|nr:TonB-dependent receptor [Gilliamella apicola]OCG05341.1 hypothetical protein A9G12_06345 [Gilliamella apicola]
MYKIKKTAQLTIISSLCSTILFSHYAFAETKPDIIVVTPDQNLDNKSSLSPTYQQEQAKLKQTAGATNLIIPEQENRLSTLQDALDFQPGIIIQNFFGGTDQPRLNIRGSGVQNFPLSRGVLLLQDGLPITDADGDFHISTLDMRDTRLISVYRGANNSHPQSNSLGGELNFISYTGKDELGTARYEYGSFGREAAQVALGNDSKEYGIDGRLSLSYDHFDGYRDHSTSQRKTVRSNFGYSNENFENRTWLSWTDLRFDIPGPLSQHKLKSDPTSIFKVVAMRDPHRNVQQGRIANRSNWTIGDQSIELGLWHQRTHDNFVTPTTYILSGANTSGAQLSYNAVLGDFSYRSALAWDKTDLDRQLLMNRRNTKMNKRKLGKFDATAENIYGSIGTSWQINPDWQLNLDTKVTHAKRDVDTRHSKNSLDQSWTFWSPKLGLIWNATTDNRFYANLSTSNEPASFREIITSDGTKAKVNKLNRQKGVTAEIGGSGKIIQGLNWDVALYRSIIKDEYITTYDASGNAIGVFNYASKTRHQGIEAGIKGLTPSLFASGDIEYRLAWTYSDFRFMGGEYNHNYIAGIPRNIITADILYKVNNWTFGPNIHWSPTNTPVDHANNMKVQYRDQYATFGFKVNYQSPDGWSAYLTADNLTDKRYATASVANRVVTSKDEMTLFPGMGFNLNGGIIYHF